MESEEIVRAARARIGRNPRPPPDPPSTPNLAQAAPVEPVTRFLIPQRLAGGACRGPAASQPLNGSREGRETAGRAPPSGRDERPRRGGGLVPARNAGDDEARRATPHPAAPPVSAGGESAPGQPKEEWERDAPGEVPSVQELLSRVDRIIESARPQKGPDAPAVASQDESGAASRPVNAPEPRLPHPSIHPETAFGEEDRHRVIIR